MKHIGTAKQTPKKLQSREAAMQWGISPIAALASGGARLMSALAPGEAAGVPGERLAAANPNRRKAGLIAGLRKGRGAVPTGAGRRAPWGATSRTMDFTFVKYKRK